MVAPASPAHRTRRLPYFWVHCEPLAKRRKQRLPGVFGSQGYRWLRCQRVLRDENVCMALDSFLKVDTYSWRARIAPLRARVVPRPGYPRLPPCRRRVPRPHAARARGTSCSVDVGRVRRPPQPFRVERLCDLFAFLNFGVTGTRLSQRGRDRWSVSTLYAGHVAARRISLST